MTEREHPEEIKVKVTDRRRVRPEGERAGPASAVPAGQPPAGEPPAGPGEQGAAAAEDLRAEIEAARAQAAEYLDHLQRLKAEFANYRRRMLTEQTRAVELAATPLVRRLLEVLDEFDLALMAAGQRPDLARFVRGVELVYAKLLDILKAEGLEPIEAEGAPFDPARHEALLHAGDGEPGAEPVVVEVLRQGYTLKGQVLRPAGVKVSGR